MKKINIKIANIKLCITMSLIALCTIVYAQKEIKLSSIKLNAIAKFAEQSHDYYAAIAALIQIESIAKPDADRSYKLAELYKTTRQYSNATTYYKKAFNLNNKNSTALYYQALTAKMCNNYTEAVDLFEQLISICKTPQLKKQAQTEIEGCKLAIDFKPTKKMRIVIEPTQTLNTASSESAPVFINDSVIIYASVLQNENGFKQFISANKKNNTWFPETSNKKYIEAFDQHQNNAAISSDGKRFYYTLTSTTFNNNTITEIYISYKTGSNWSDAQKLNENINTPGYNTTQPTIATGKNNTDIIYFVSNKPGGKGGLDIWFSVYDIKKNMFSTARNITKLNTANDEMTPFYDNTNKTLYFASNGWAGFGGFDIFKSTGDQTKWTTVKNLGQPFNTNADDLYFTLNSKSNEGFIVSNRSFNGDNQAQCCDDLISFKITKNNKTTIKGTVVQQSDTAKLIAIPIAIYVTTETNEDLFIDSIYSTNNGEFTFEANDDMNYKLVVGNNEFIRQELSLETINSNENNEILCQLNLTRISDAPLILDNVYYAFNESSITDESKLMLDQTVIPMLTLNSNIKMEIRAYTDNIGNDSYNLDLSQKRAESVVTYLISKGIPSERLYAFGLGELITVEDNISNEQVHSNNRRTEFRIISDSSQIASNRPFIQ